MPRDTTTLASEFPPPPADGYSWRYVLNVAREHRTEIVIANFVALLAVLASVPVPLLLPLLVDEVLLNKPGKLVATLDRVFPSDWHGPVLYISVMLIVTMFLRLATLTFSVLQTRGFTRVAKDITYRMRGALLRHLETVSMSEYETLGSGAVASHFVTDMNTLDEFIGASISKLVIAALSLVGVSAILLWMHWQLALFILLLNPLVIYFTVVLGKRVKKLKRAENSAFEMFQSALGETLDAIQQLRAANRQRHYLLNVIDRARGIKTHSAAFSWKSDAASRFSFAVFLVGFDLFRGLSMLMVVYSTLTIGEMLAVFGYLWFMMSPVQELLGIQYGYFGARAAMGRINRLLQLHQEPSYPATRDPFAGKTTVGVRVENVEFTYGENVPVLKGVTLDIHPGEKVALVGASGGGKSTLVQVLLGMYTPQHGMLYFDGVPVTDIGLDVVRANVACVLQHPALFNDTVRTNLTLGRDIGEAELWRALEAAQLRETVEAMPLKLDNIVGRQGVRLSGGQRQRLAIARMILSDPKVVILDEATSALDAATEARLHEALREFLKDRTTLIVAHRLSAVKQADRVFVFEDGQIAEHGAHEELLRGGGLYSKLYGQLQH